MKVTVNNGMSDIARDSWNRVAGDEYPFLRHEFLQLAEQTGCVSPNAGWSPRHLTIWDGSDLRAALPLYEKSHSWANSSSIGRGLMPTTRPDSVTTQSSCQLCHSPLRQAAACCWQIRMIPKRLRHYCEARSSWREKRSARRCMFYFRPTLTCRSLRMRDS